MSQLAHNTEYSRGSYLHAQREGERDGRTGKQRPTISYNQIDDFRVIELLKGQTLRSNRVKDLNQTFQEQKRHKNSTSITRHTMHLKSVRHRLSLRNGRAHQSFYHLGHSCHTREGAKKQTLLV